MGLANKTTTTPGILGIGLRENEGPARNRKLPAYNNLVDTMVAQDVIKTQAFSLWLDDAGM
jgi:hypothetical protein